MICGYLMDGRSSSPIHSVMTQEYISRVDYQIDVPEDIDSKAVMSETLNCY